MFGSFFFSPKLQYHSTEKEESTLEESTTQAERITSGRFSSLKHKGEAKLKANFAAIWAATLQNLRAQTKEQQRKDKAELRILKISLLMAQLGTEGLSDRESMHNLESLFMSTWFHLSREARLTAHWIALASAWMGGQLWWGLAQTLITSSKEFLAATARAVLDKLTAASTFSLMKPGEGGFQLWCPGGVVGRVWLYHRCTGHVVNQFWNLSRFRTRLL